MILFFTENVEHYAGPVSRALRQELGEEVRIGGLMRITPESYDRHRDQYDASWLLGHLLSRVRERSIWLVDSDIFVDAMNFVFGYASVGRGAVVSTWRLPNEEMVVKEVMHEAGHVLGLRHCENECVMKFSNTLAEAIRKPCTLCVECRRRLGEVTA